MAMRDAFQGWPVIGIRIERRRAMITATATDAGGSSGKHQSTWGSDERDSSYGDEVSWLRLKLKVKLMPEDPPVRWKSNGEKRKREKR